MISIGFVYTNQYGFSWNSGRGIVDLAYRYPLIGTTTLAEMSSESVLESCTPLSCMENATIVAHKGQLAGALNDNCLL